MLSGPADWADRPEWLLVLQWVDRVPWGVWWQGARSGAPGNVRSGGLRPGGQSAAKAENYIRSVEATDLEERCSSSRGGLRYMKGKRCWETGL